MKINLKEKKYYIAKICFFEGNTTNKYIIYVNYSDKNYQIINVFLKGLSREFTIKNLKYFEIIEEIIL